jgi:hypothetical protein
MASKANMAGVHVTFNSESVTDLYGYYKPEPEPGLVLQE